ncbi:hypothetical protein, partial [Marivita sp.]|uniref:hypothetical protein n=1 Tax=Marivita sp. TaxID=2003365 RepID=UPI003F72BE3B
TKPGLDCAEDADLNVSGVDARSGAETNPNMTGMPARRRVVVFEIIVLLLSSYEQCCSKNHDGAVGRFDFDAAAHTNFTSQTL